MPKSITTMLSAVFLAVRLYSSKWFSNAEAYANVQGLNGRSVAPYSAFANHPFNFAYWLVETST